MTLTLNEELITEKISWVSHTSKLVREWDTMKNVSLGLDLLKMTKGSQKRAFWKCKVYGHEWD